MSDKPLPAIEGVDNLFSLPLLCIAAAVLLSLSALFSVSESALLAMNKLRLRIKCRANDKRSLRVARLLKHKDVLINSLLAANCLANISLSSLVAKAAMQVWGSAALSIAAAGTTVVLLIFGEITPKTLAARHADSIAYSLSLFVTVTVAIFCPVAGAFTRVAHFVLRTFGLNTASSKLSYTEDDIKTVIHEGESSGALEKGESNMAQGVFRFTDLEARDIMVPRKDIIAIEQGASRAEITALSLKSGHSRFPVYKNTIDNITGVLYVKDLLKDREGITAGRIMRRPLFILGGKKMSSIQSMLQENHQSMAIVVDEYSGTDGILTITDITERIFGISPSGNTAEQSSSSSSTVNGTMLLSELRERLHIPIHSDMNETLSGWLSERLGDLPKAGDTVHYCGYIFCVTETGGHCVESVRITDTNNKAKEA